jgi:hypothetical protein
MNIPGAKTGIGLDLPPGPVRLLPPLLSGGGGGEGADRQTDR